jgi:hypothetical protein
MGIAPFSDVMFGFCFGDYIPDHGITQAFFMDANEQGWIRGCFQEKGSSLLLTYLGTSGWKA